MNNIRIGFVLFTVRVKTMKLKFEVVKVFLIAEAQAECCMIMALLLRKIRKWKIEAKSLEQ